MRSLRHWHQCRCGTYSFSLLLVKFQPVNLHVQNCFIFLSERHESSGQSSPTSGVGLLQMVSHFSWQSSFWRASQEVSPKPQHFHPCFTDDIKLFTWCLYKIIPRAANGPPAIALTPLVLKKRSSTGADPGKNGKDIYWASSNVNRK